MPLGASFFLGLASIFGCTRDAETPHFASGPTTTAISDLAYQRRAIPSPNRPQFSPQAAMASGSEKPKPSKTKSKLKPHKSIKHKRKNRNPNVNTQAEVKKGKEKVITKGGTNGGSGSDTTLISVYPTDRQLHFFLHCYQTGTKSKLSPLELEAYKGTSPSMMLVPFYIATVLV